MSDIPLTPPAGPVTPIDTAQAISDIHAELRQLRRMPEQLPAKFILAVTFDGPCYAGYHKGRVPSGGGMGSYSIYHYELTADTVASTSTTIAIDVDGSDAATITVPSATGAQEGDLEVGISVGVDQGPKAYIDTAGTDLADVVLFLFCQRGDRG